MSSEDFDKDYYRSLADKWVNGTITGAELKELEAWYNADRERPVMLASDFATGRQGLADEMFDAISQKTGTARQKHGPVKRFGLYRWAAVAVLIIGTGLGLRYYFTQNRNTGHRVAVHYKGDVAPGHSGAVLHLSDGSVVALDDAHDGLIASQGSIQAIKENGVLKYRGKDTATVFNTITTERGRQWQLTLPDGTQVWLNAASSLRYPLCFTGAAREVELTGEGYFEVVHNSRQPFRVKVNGRTIEDIGTAFDINAYADEPQMKATLAQGAIRIDNTVLKPGQQVVIINEKTTVSEGNVEQALAWKNGYFSFKHADIHEVMRQIARWYNVEVVYEGQPDSEPFEGEIGKGLTLVQLLKGLNRLHVHFRIEEDKRIVILPSAGD